MNDTELEPQSPDLTAVPDMTTLPDAQEVVAAAERIAALEGEIAQLKDQLLRAVAETENVRRRLEQQAEDRGKYAVTGFAKDVLPVADNLRRALENLPAEALAADELAKKLAEGVELTERGFLAALERHGIQRVEALGQRFDPHFHQAMMEIDDPTQTAGLVVLEMQAGYTLHGRLLRAAMVGVSKGGPKAGPAEGGVDTTA